MSHPGEAGQNEELEFKWGQKKSVGGKNREVQFYGSFTYDGVDYSLYDCVYMHHEEEGEPYIGKLIKIWETADKKKKVKIHWFFHSSEITNWLGDEEVHPNEIFLASGEGAGKTNINDLEAIAGKCNVVCISKDSRNPQPSEQELQMADYVFHRTFDVQQCTILDKIDDKVTGLAVQFLFNVPKLDSVKKDEPIEFKTEWTDGNSNGLVPRGSEDFKDSLVGRKSLPDEPASEAALATTIGQQLYLAGEKATTHRMERDKNEMKKSKVPANHIEAEDEGKSSQDPGAFDNKASKNPTADGSVKFSQSRNINSKITVNINDAKAMVTSTTTEKKPKTVPAKDILGSEKGVKSLRDTGALDERPYKKARVDCSVKVSANKNDIGGQKLSLNSERKKGKDLSAPLSSGGVVKAGVSSHWPDKDPKQKTDEKMTKLINGKLLNLSAKNCQGENRIPEGNTSQVIPKPVNVRGNWFRQLPWEDRMITAQEQGTLIQLSNLDPAYTSKQVEDIIWHALKEKCTAKMVQRTAISSPHSGQAFLILKTRGAAESIVRELDERCLMLSNRSPLVGRIVPPRSVQKKSAFFGHLSIDIIRHQMQREWKEALSTSHYSQPNNIEYEMAMEWCLLQSRSKLCWNKFYRIQGEELRKLKANLKLK